MKDKQSETQKDNNSYANNPQQTGFSPQIGSVRHTANGSKRSMFSRAATSNNIGTEDDPTSNQSEQKGDRQTRQQVQDINSAAIADNTHDKQRLIMVSDDEMHKRTHHGSFMVNSVTNGNTKEIKLTKDKPPKKKNKSISNKLMMHEQIMNSIESTNHKIAKKHKGHSRHQIQMDNSHLFQTQSDQINNAHTQRKKKAPELMLTTDSYQKASELVLSGNRGNRKLVQEYQNSQPGPYMNPNHSLTQKPIMAMMMTKDGALKQTNIHGNRKSAQGHQNLQGVNKKNQGYQMNTTGQYFTQQQQTAGSQTHKIKQGHRKHHPMPIDTFNIVGDRRKSLVKQVNEANANSNAIISLNYQGPADTNLPKTPDDSNNKNGKVFLPFIPNVQKGLTDMSSGSQSRIDNQPTRMNMANSRQTQLSNTKNSLETRDNASANYQTDVNASIQINSGHMQLNKTDKFYDSMAEKMNPRQSNYMNQRKKNYTEYSKEVSNINSSNVPTSPNSKRNVKGQNFLSADNHSVQNEPIVVDPSSIVYPNPNHNGEHTEIHHQSSGSSMTRSDQDDSYGEEEIIEGDHSPEQFKSSKSFQMQPQDASFHNSANEGEITRDQYNTNMAKIQGANKTYQPKQQYIRQKESSSHNVNPGTKEQYKRKNKKHKRHNTHHHYHIDFNFEQVNNILVSYGGMGLHQQLKNQIKKEGSKANVSLSIGAMNGQFGQSQHAKGQSINIQNVQENKAQPPQSPSKRMQMQHNPLLLPELIINKNKINFGSKKFQLHMDENKLANRPQKDSAGGSHHYQGEHLNSNNKTQKVKKKRVRKGDHHNQDDVDQSHVKSQSPSKRHTVSSNPHHHQQDHRNLVKDQTIIQLKEVKETPLEIKQNAQTLPRQAIKSQTGIQSKQRERNADEKMSKTQDQFAQSQNRLPESKISNDKVDSVVEDSRDKKLQQQKSQQHYRTDKKEKEQDVVPEKSGPGSKRNSRVSFSLNKTMMNQSTSNYPAKPGMPPAIRHNHGVPNLPPGPSAISSENTLKMRSKKILKVATKPVPESPRKYFNVKANNGSQTVKMVVSEHHSAGLRQPAGVKNTPGMKATNYNTISHESLPDSAACESPRAKGQNQIHQSIQSGNGGHTSLHTSAQRPRSPNKFRKTQTGKKDGQTRRTQQMLAQFNASNRAPELNNDIEEPSEAASPTKQKEKFSLTIKGEKPKITDFDVQEVVGIGGFGRVYKAINKKENNRVCALKVLKKESVAQMKHVDHIISEREVLQYLIDKRNQYYEEQKDLIEPGDEFVPECPFLMGIFSSFQDKENLYFELEYIQGCTMLSEIRKFNPLVQQNMTYYAAEVLLTLDYLHSNNIIYRDLKPENIVISMLERGHIKLVDFGFAKQLKSQFGRTNTNCGTPAYIAPEILRGSNEHGEEVDIWSFGVLMVEIISGQTPFIAETSEAVYEKIAQCQPTYTKSVGPVLRDLLAKIFVPDPAQRITVDDIKEHRLFKDYDWTVTMAERFQNSTAPYIPEEAVFNEEANRCSEEEAVPIKPKNLLAALMGNPAAQLDAPILKPKTLEFDGGHYDKFIRTNKDEEDNGVRRKRQNPLGDFKFVRINEYF